MTTTPDRGRHVSRAARGCPAVTRRRSGRTCLRRAVGRAAARARRRPATATSGTSTGSMRRPTPHAPLVVLFHGLEGSAQSHYARAMLAHLRVARLARRRAAFSRLQRRAEPPAARLSFGRSRGGRRRCSRRSASASGRRRPMSRGGRLARRQRAAQLARPRRQSDARQRAGRRRRGVRAARSDGRRASRSARGFNRIYTHYFLRTLKPKALAMARALSRPARSRRDRAACARCGSSTTPSPRRCTASPAPTTTGRARRRSRGCARSRCRRSCSTRATIPFVPGELAAAAPTRSARAVTLEQPAHGGHVGFVDRAARPGASTGCRGACSTSSSHGV